MNHEIYKKSQFILNKKENINKFYKISKDKKDIIGRGKFGIVLKAINKLTNEIKAVKIIKKRNFKKLEESNNLKEYIIMKKWDHPNIIQAFEIFEDKKYYYLVMEYLKGGNILELLNEKVKLEENYCREIMYQILKSISYLHSKKICHRDIKLENIMFVSKNSNYIKLIDFGISKFFKNLKEKMLSKKGSILYFSPEIIEGEYDELIDIWSAGVIMYTILSGFPPFIGNNINDLAEKINNLDFTFNNEIWKNISNEAKDLIKSMLCKKEIRLNPNEILNHSWFNKRKSNLNTLNIENFEKYFKNSNNFEKIILNHLASKLNVKECINLKNLFLKFDTKNNGKIKINNIYKNLNFGKKDLESLKFRENCTFFEQKIGFNEFKAIFIDFKQIDNINLLLYEIFNSFNWKNNEIFELIKKVKINKNIDDNEFKNYNSFTFNEFKNLILK